MKNYRNLRSYRGLEYISNPESISHVYRPKVLPLLRRAWSHFQYIFFMSNEPRIRQKKNRFGKIFWKIYDPVGKQSFRLDSEEDVLVWLEERHHRNSQKNHKNSLDNSWNFYWDYYRKW